MEIVNKIIKHIHFLKTKYISRNFSQTKQYKSCENQTIQNGMPVQNETNVNEFS